MDCRFETLLLVAGLSRTVADFNPPRAVPKRDCHEEGNFLSCSDCIQASRDHLQEVLDDTQSLLREMRYQRYISGGRDV